MLARLLGCLVLLGAELALAAPGRVRSFRARRDEGVVRQQFDHSCGAAALATLLSNTAGDTVTEREILLAADRIVAPHERVRLRREGLSLAEIQQIVRERGHEAIGFRMPAADLPLLEGPVLVFFHPEGRAHFAVLKGVRDGWVHLADPAAGHRRIPFDRFVASWADAAGEGVALAIEPKDGARLGALVVPGDSKNARDAHPSTALFVPSLPGHH